ncbi:serine/threonine-protein kinase [Dolichospermum circinale CS-1225]|uniref:Serine/threonine-protein kinase n=1 Tax=Dolichospermum circinale CS-537/01 TaxID=3021739 RepID=A0ABT5A6X4_9CYAN|nr:serine/threonine-protein kinase [Dolichospermum circinale]MDB9487701.1 serine/threonine-protein kinase [Dolichospermum circinale CS-537/01]MDB9523671.1 serine/threonine-protein kinase [Dolichospermum circinale CS-1225]
MIEPGDFISGRYYIIQELGDGGFAKTFEADDCVNGDHKVIKILNLDYSGNPNILKLFEQEYRVLSNLNHPGIPKVEIDGYLRFSCPHTQEILHGLVMEKIEGQDLGKWLRSNQKIANETQAIDWLKQLIDILDHVHSQNYVHRDIKPDNIMLKPNGQLVLIDFGIVKEYIQKTQRQTIANTIIGTPGYSSPEQERQQSGWELNYTSDFFSLGRTFVHLLTAIFPDNENLKPDLLSGNEVLLWRDQAPEFSEQFKNLIDDLMEYNPKNRPKNTQEILWLIKKLEDQKSFPPPIVFLSFTLNFVFLTLLAMGVTLTVGWKVLFLVVICGIGGFLVTPLIKYLF